MQTATSSALSPAIAYRDSTVDATSLMRPRVIARAAGILLLLTLIGGIYAQGFVSDQLISFTDAALTARNILGHQSVFQLSFAVFLLEMTCQIASVALFYRLLSPVSRSLALVSTCVELSGAVIKTLSRLFYITPLFVLSGTSALNAFSAEQLRAIALLLLKINDRGAAMALAFFGVSAVLHGYLIFRSTFLPRALGIACMIAGAGWLRFYYPPLHFPSFMMIAALALLVSAVEIFWLIVFGVDEEKWKERYRLSR
ncbi:MAG: DUF4386 domain-containing protein [Acidobacteria bacterium]|nr:DUF4386 domain-containing protein [Acidobacteriota bacterium]MBV9475957.1 DUF4386 domain-containing protein [Acidobacteriota bacterium]